jgi:hypothetical protein
MQKLHEGVKLDTGLYPMTNATSQTGVYFPYDKYRQGVYHLMASGMTDGQSLIFAVYEAKDAAGTDAAQLGANVTLSQGTKINKCQITCASVSVSDTVIITMYKLEHGELVAQTALTFTAAAAESLTNRQFNQASTDAACATSLAACINHATYGVSGMTAAAVDAVVTLSITVPGDGVFDITELAAAVARLVVVDLEQQAYFAVLADELTSGFTHAGARVSSVDTNVELACSLLRSLPRYSVVGQSVAAYDDSE